MGQKTLEKNKEALKSINPDLVQWLKEAKPVDWIDYVKSYDGYDNILIKHGSHLQANYDMKNTKQDIENMSHYLQLYKQNVTILIGCGLGYIIKKIFQNMEKGHIIVVFEATAHMLLLAMSTVDMSKHLQDGSLIISNATNKTEIAAIISFIDSVNVIENWNLLIEKYTQIRPNEYNIIIKDILDVINQTKCNTGTMMSAGGKIADNDIVSLPYVIRHRGVAELKDLFKGKPAILVSTGPSLSKNIHEIAQIKNKVIIVAVAQALRPLLAYDIRPDFICSVDFGQVNMTHLEGIMDSDTPLIALNRSYAPLLMQYQGPKFIVISPSPGFEQTIVGLMQNRGSLDQGGSVAHLCMSFAHHLGCDTIILTGQDLAYEKNFSHIPLADSGGKIIKDENGKLTWEVKDQRSNIYSKEKNKYSMGLSYKVPGYFGDTVDTNAGLLCFITSFENMASSLSKEVKLFNATEGGAEIKNIESKILQDCITDNNIDTNPDIDKSVIKPLLSLNPDTNEDIKKAIKLIEIDLKTLKLIIDESKKGLELNTKIGKITKKNEISVLNRKERTNLKNLLKKNHEHSTKAHEASKKNSLVALTIYNASRQILGRKLNVAHKMRHVLKDKETLSTRLESNKLILSTAKEASIQLTISYKKTLKVLKDYLKTENESLLTTKPNYKISFDDVDTYFEAGNFAHPLLDARKILQNKSNQLSNTKLYEKALEVETKALAMRNETIETYKKIDKDPFRKLLKYNKLIEESRKIGREEKDFIKSLEKIKEAVEIFPDKPEARWGLATTYYHIQEYDKAVETYKELVNDFPDNIVFQFELGQAQITAGDDNGIFTIKEVLSKTKRFDSFLKHLAKLYYNKEKYKEACIACSLYLKKYPVDTIIWNLLGDCHEQLKNIKKSESAYKQAKKVKTIDKFNELWDEK